MFYEIYIGVSVYDNACKLPRYEIPCLGAAASNVMARSALKNFHATPAINNKNLLSGSQTYIVSDDIIVQGVCCRDLDINRFVSCDDVSLQTSSSANAIQI